MEGGNKLFDICIFCALHEEAEALIAEFEDRCQVTFQRGFSRRTQYVYQHTTIENRRREPLTILVTWSSNHGPVQTAMDLILFLEEFRPRFAAMTGFCAGDQREVKRGDLIVAKCAYLYEEGKIITGSNGQPTQLLETTTMASTSQVLQYVQGFHEWKTPLREMKQAWLKRPLHPDEEPHCFITPMASGMAVRSDNPFPWLRERSNRNVLGLDMEAASFYRALGTFSHIHALVVKGVSDYGDHTKNDLFHAFAARASAVYLLHFIQEYVTSETMQRLSPLSDWVPSRAWDMFPGRNPSVTDREELLKQRNSSLRTASHDKPSSSEALWAVPYRQNRFFVGRETLLEHLSSAFSLWEALTTPVVALCGLGGVGKTQTALEYAYRSLGRYQAIFWINASSQETLVADLVALAETLGISSAKELETPEPLLLVRRWLEQHQRWLLILDALADFSLVFDALPSRSAGHVLVTTQMRVSHTVSRVLEVGPLSEQEALTLLIRRSGLFSQESSFHQMASEDGAAAHRLCQLFDGLPLALDQAGAYIEQTGCSVAEYEQHYHAQQLPFLQQRGDRTLDHPSSVVATWSLTFQQVEACDPCAADLLRACAFLAPEVIPQALFLKGARLLGPHLVNLESDPMLFDAAIRTLRQFSLVKRDSQTQTISLHRLVQVVLRTLLPPDQQALWAERVVQALCAAFPHRQELEWTHCTFYLAHVRACEELLTSYHLSLPMLGAIVYRVGRFFHDHGQYQEASACYQRARALCQTAPITADGEGLPHILESLGWLALGQRRFADANAFLHEAWTLKQQVYGDCHPETARTLHVLGRVAQAQHHFEEAEQFYRQALQIKEQILGKEHEETATTVLALGWLLFDQQQYSLAYHFYQQALRVRIKVLGMEHVGTAVVLHLLARLAQQQQQYYEAEMLFLQALSIKKQVLCMDHPSIAITLQALAQLYQEQQRFPDAETRYKEALRIREQRLGSEHLLTAETLYHLARCYQEQGQFPETEEFSFGVQGQVYGLDHPTTLLSLHPYGRLVSSQQRWQEAEGMYQRVLAIREHTLGRNHPTVQSVIQAYARLLRFVHRERDAQALEEHNVSQE